MKLQSLAIMFIVLILPISIVLGSYTQTRVETLSLQAEYDSKLNDSTYDALKAYQINSLTSSSGDFTNSKIRDIKASINTFFNSMAVNFSSAGYSKTTLQNYVPALVYTMYDGYYIYSPYENIWDEETINGHKDDPSYNGTLIDNPDKEKLYGLKPYIYYSCRYKNSNCDVVITYSLDSYIQIQGIVQDKPVSKSGYLLSNVEKKGNVLTYNGVEINSSEMLQEYVICADTDGKTDISGTYPYIKKNGMKYYLSGNEIFYVLNGQKIKQSNITVEDIRNNSSAMKYYEEAYNLKQYIEKSPLADLSTNDIVKEDVTRYREGEENPYTELNKIFDFNHDNGIEASDSNFNTHRIDVIKHSIERNLSIAINNFNNYSNATTNFQMPKLKDSEWDKIMDNISIISFLQGINIGGKVYNGYSIITNTKNEDVVMEDSIYIITQDDNVAHRVTENNLTASNTIGVFNVNLERRTEEILSTTKYYFPINATLSYDSIVTQNKVANLTNTTLKEYLKNKPELAKIYYTALGRERYGLYRQRLEINENNYK